MIWVKKKYGLIICRLRTNIYRTDDNTQVEIMPTYCFIY